MSLGATIWPDFKGEVNLGHLGNIRTFPKAIKFSQIKSFMAQEQSRDENLLGHVFVVCKKSLSNAKKGGNVV